MGRNCIIDCQRKSMNYKVVRITGDGNCFFRAVSFHFYGHERMHGDIRRKVVAYVTSHWTEFNEFVTGDVSYGVSITSPEEYSETMSRDGQYAGMQEALAVSKIFNVRVLIFNAQDLQTRPNVVGSVTANDNSLLLLFRGHPDSGHFDLLID